MQKRIVAYLLLFATVSTSLTGCGFKIGNIVIGTEAPVEEITEEEAAARESAAASTALEDDSYYILANNQYEQLYFGNASFEEGTTVVEPAVNRLLWYVDDETENADINYIPTIYSDEKLVYRYGDTLTETFNFERLYDLGRSFAVYGLKETVSGRYSLLLEEDSIYPDSDLKTAIAEVMSSSVIFEQMNTIKIRTDLGLVTDYGTLTNFCFDEDGNVIPANPNEEYTFLIYSGTYKNKVRLTPNYRILGSSEVYISNEYMFIDDDVISITIPTWFESGYYLINGVGVFRYINAPAGTYTEEEIASLDMNTPTKTSGIEGNYSSINSPGVSGAITRGGLSEDDVMLTLNYEDDGTWSFSTPKAGYYDIYAKVNLSNIEGLDSYEEPICKVISAAKKYGLEYDPETQTIIGDKILLPAGEIKLNFENISGAPTITIQEHL